MSPSRLIPDQLARKLNEFSIGQRRASLVAGSAILVALTWAIVQHHASPRLVPLSIDSSQQLSRISAELDRNQLNDYQIDAERLLVPEDRLSEYERAISDSRETSAGWASDWEQKYEATSPFTSSRKLRMMKEISLAKELKRIIESLDGVEEASVVWADSEARSFQPRRDNVTATVNLRSTIDRRLSEQTIRAIQFSVANMIADLSPEHVVVFDATTGRHYQMDEQQARFETELDTWLEREQSDWSQRLQMILARHWANAKLDLHFDTALVRAFARQEWNRFPHDRPVHYGEESDSKPIEFADVRDTLAGRLPEFFQIRVELPPSQQQQVGGESPQPSEQELSSWVRRELQAVLPLSFPEQSIVVSFAESRHTPQGEIAQVHSLDRAWKPAALIAMLGLGLYFVSRRLNSARPNFANNAPPSEEMPRADSTAATPLGDPELVASVLKNWLDRSGNHHE